MAIHTILVTGANGQLGWELSQLAKSYPAFKFVLVDRTQLDLAFPETFEKMMVGRHLSNGLPMVVAVA